MNIVSSIAIGLALVLACLFLIYRDYLTESEKAFGYFVIACAFFEVLAKVMAGLSISNNLPGLHLYTLIQFITLTRFFGLVIEELEHRVNWKLITLIGSALIILNSLFLQNIYTFNSYSKTAVEMLIILACVGVFLLKIKSPLKEHAKRSATLIFTMAIFIKASFSIMIYLYSAEIAHMAKEVGLKFWVINGVINILTYGVVLYGLILIVIKKEDLTRAERSLVK